jgi:hypothetical protein
MKCIDEALLQKYIDGECSGKENSDIENHFSNCPECKFRYAEKLKISMEMKQALSSLNSGNVVIPKFKIPTKHSGKTRKLFIISLPAACIMLFALFLSKNKTEFTQEELIVVESIPWEIDANLPASEQDFVIEVFDEKGSRSEYILE